MLQCVYIVILATWIHFFLMKQKTLISNSLHCKKEKKFFFYLISNRGYFEKRKPTRFETQVSGQFCYCHYGTIHFGLVSLDRFVIMIFVVVVVHI